MRYNMDAGTRALLVFVVLCCALLAAVAETTRAVSTVATGRSAGASSRLVEVEASAESTDGFRGDHLEEVSRKYKKKYGYKKKNKKYKYHQPKPHYPKPQPSPTKKACVFPKVSASSDTNVTGTIVHDPSCHSDLDCCTGLCNIEVGFLDGTVDDRSSCPLYFGNFRNSKCCLPEGRNFQGLVKGAGGADKFDVDALDRLACLCCDGRALNISGTTTCTLEPSSDMAFVCPTPMTSLIPMTSYGY